MMTSDLKLCCVIRGTNRFRYRGTTRLAQGGTLILAEPGEVHAVESVAGAFDVLVLFVDAATVSGLRGDDAGVLKNGLTFREPLSQDREAVLAFEAFARTLTDGAAPGLLVEERLFALADAVSRTYEGCVPAIDRSIAGDAVRRAREMLHDRYLDAITLDELTAQSCFAKPRFLRAFKRLVGLSPHAYQIHLRVDHARRMLASGSPIADAAASAGFFDQSHFHRHFKRLHGLTPARYRRFSISPETP